MATDRLDQEPAIFKGCSLSELTTMVIGSGVFLLPFSLILASLFGSTVMGFGIAGILLVSSVYVEATVFCRLKAHRPNGYYQQRVHLFLAKHGILKSRLLTRSGIWDIGRS